jgi:hypothetical protein
MMQGFGRKKVAVVLAHNARLAMQWQQCIAVNEQAVGQLAAYGALQGVFANVSKSTVPEQAVQDQFALQGAFWGLWCAYIEPGCVLADYCSEHRLSIAQEEYAGALNLHVEAIV